jgi:glycosyltransferase involved in cell wall biosynthesis
MQERRSRRRVLIIVQNLPVPFDRRVWQEAKTLVSAGYAVSVICPKGKGFTADHEVLEGVHIWRHPLPLEASGRFAFLIEYAASLYWELVLAFKVARARGFDVIHACNPPDLIFLVAWLFRLLGKRFVFDHHDLNPELFEAKFNRRGFFHKLLLLTEKLTFKTASISIATNESYKKIAIERGGMRPDRVFVVRSGPDVSRFKAASPDPKWRNGRKHLIGYVGVMGQQEGVHYLIDAMHHLHHVRGRTDVQAVLVGGGPELETLKDYARERRLADAITFTGSVPDSILTSALSTADVCVNPDVVNPFNDKSTMNKIMEYMALGKPVVQFDMTEGRVSAGEASLYAKPNDAVDLAVQTLGLLDDPDRCARMGDFGRRRVETELAWTYEAPRLLEAYAQLWRLMPHRVAARPLVAPPDGNAASIGR